MLPMQHFRLRVEFTEPVLGSQPGKNVAEEYLLAKARAQNPGLNTDDEAESLTEDEALEKGTTVFHKHPEGRYLLFNYQQKGFVKEVARIFNGHQGVKNMRNKVANLLWVHPRRIYLNLPEGAEVDYLERPLRAETAQGPRVALARSEMLPAGTWFECYLRVYKSDLTEELLRDLLSFGRDQGLGQWRSSGIYGTFRYTLTALEKPPPGSEQW